MQKNILPSSTYQLQTGCGNMYLTMVYNTDNSINRVLLELGKSGTCAKAHLSSYAELISFILSNNTPNECILALNKASGHICQHKSDTCLDIVNRFIMNILISRGEINARE